MRSLNQVMMIGHLAANPEIHTSATGVKVVSFAVATNRDWTTSDGTKKEAVDYHKVVAFRRLAEVCAQHLVKGSPVYVQGRLQNTSFDGTDGKKHFFTEIVLDQLSILVYKKGKTGVELNVQNVTTPTDSTEETSK